MEKSFVLENYSKELDFKLNSTYDAVLVHSYWLSRNRMVMDYQVDEFRGSLRTRLATRAAVLLGENAEKIVFTGGHLKGPSYSSTAGLSKNEAISKYGVSDERIIALEKAYGTEEEIDIFKELAEENGWKNVALIGFKKHFKTIKEFMPEGLNEELNVTHLAVEDIIAKKDDQRIQKLVKRLNSSCYEKIYIPYELIVYLGIKTGLKNFAYRKNKEARVKKDDDWINDRVVHLIDVFKS